MQPEPDVNDKLGELYKKFPYHQQMYGGYGLHNYPGQHPYGYPGYPGYQHYAGKNQVPVVGKDGKEVLKDHPNHPLNWHRGYMGGFPYQNGYNGAHLGPHHNPYQNPMTYY